MKTFFLLAVIMVFGCNPAIPILLFKEKNAIKLEGIGTHSLLQIDSAGVTFLSSTTLNTFDVAVPFDGKSLALNLKRLNLFSQDFSVQTNNGRVLYEPGKYFRGTIDGDPTSVVTISIVDGEITGMVSSKDLGNLNIGKYGPDYLIMEQNNNGDITFKCDAVENDSLIRAVEAQLKNTIRVKSVGNPCVKIDYELTYEVYQHFGTVASAVNWFTGIFAGCQSIYAAAGITVNINYMYVWTAPDGYSKNTAEALVDFSKRRVNDPAYKGNLAQLVRGMNGGALSGIAYVNGLCAPAYRFSVAEPMFNYATFAPGTPAASLPFSWSVEVITHELGHNLSSPHTHSCTWPGGPIDNCYTQEGSCPPGPTPGPGKGTIMSYCHLTSIGINFSNGFGPLPQAKILSAVNSGCVPMDCGTPPPPPPPTPVDTANPVNIAKGAKSFQSSEYGGYPASNAVDDNMSTFNHTNAEVAPWLYVDLGAIKDIRNVKIYSRVDCCNGRIRNLKVWLFNDMPPVIGDYNQPNPIYAANGYLQPNQSLDIPVNNKARYIKIQCQAIGGLTYLHIADLKAYSIGGAVVCKDSTITSVVKVTKDSLVYSTIKVCR